MNGNPRGSMLGKKVDNFDLKTSTWTIYKIVCQSIGTVSDAFHRLFQTKIMIHLKCHRHLFQQNVYLSWVVVESIIHTLGDAFNRRSFARIYRYKTFIKRLKPFFLINYGSIQSYPCHHILATMYLYIYRQPLKVYDISF